jgi:hypothetical protein
MADTSPAPALQEILERVLLALEEAGLLPHSDPRLPNVVALVAGEPVEGSWWAHPRAHAIFQVATRVDEHPGVLTLRLISGKVTYVHRRLWPAALGVACAREPWQSDSLSPAARALFEQVQAQGILTTDRHGPAPGETPKALGAAARELEARLLVHSEQFHTSRGYHAKRLSAWEAWMERAAFPGPVLPPDEAKAALEAARRALEARQGGKGRLPWEGMRKGH